MKIMPPVHASRFGKAALQSVKAAQRGISGACGKAASDGKPNKPLLPRPWIDELFTRFSLEWGPRWTASMESAEPDTAARLEESHKRYWQERLAGMTPQQISTALQVCMGRLNAAGESWPPNPGEFRHAGTVTTTTPPHWQMYRPYGRQLPARIETPMPQEAIDQHRADMRRALRGEYPTDAIEG